MHRKTFVLLVITALLGCEEGDVTSIDERTGAVAGVAFIDRDADGVLTTIDVPAAGVIAALILEATGDTVESSVTEVDGSFLIDQVPIGRYRLVARRGALGDTVEVTNISNASFTVAAGDTTLRTISLGYPTVSVATARALPTGRRIMVAGVALNSWTAFGDSTVHLRDGTGAIRAIRTQPSALQAGDSIRVFGTTGVDADAVVLADASARVLSAAVGLPAPDSVGTGSAATSADDGLVDDQVRIAGAVILDTTTVAGDRVLGVDDGSGRLEVILDRHVAFDAGPFVPGATFHGAGVLVPGADGDRRLKPRQRAEAAITFPSVTIDVVRTLEPGRSVVIEGIALNGWATFADSTIHVKDATGAIRGVRVQGSVIAAGDSVRLIGTTAVRDGQPVLSAATASRLLAAVGLPAVDSISTGAAASAEGGSRDADQVRVGGSINGSQNLPNGDVILTVDDGTGSVEVLMDRHVSFNAGPYQAGALLRVSGVLVPTAAGAWQIKPRSAADATAFYPTITVAEARALQPGQTAWVSGTALNGRDTFGDQTVHVQDATGAIRFLNVPASPSILSGYSVRILGTAAVLNGMPVLTASSIAQVSVGTLPAPDSVATQVAASADGGTRDAGQVAVSGTVSSVTVSGSDYILTISDGSGPLEVVLDAQVGFPVGAYKAGDDVRVRGVLVPKSTGSTWQLKPRSLGEIAVN